MKISIWKSILAWFFVVFFSSRITVRNVHLTCNHICFVKVNEQMIFVLYFFVFLYINVNKTNIHSEAGLLNSIHRSNLRKKNLVNFQSMLFRKLITIIVYEAACIVLSFRYLNNKVGCMRSGVVQRNLMHVNAVFYFSRSFWNLILILVSAQRSAYFCACECKIVDVILFLLCIINLVFHFIKIETVKADKLKTQ